MKSQPGTRLAGDPSQPLPPAAAAGAFLVVCLCFPPRLVLSRPQSPSPPPLQQQPSLGRTPSLHCSSVCTSWAAPANSASYPEKAPPMTPSTSSRPVSLPRLPPERDTSLWPPQGRQTLSRSSCSRLQRGQRGPCGPGCCSCGRESGSRTPRAKQGPSARQRRGSEGTGGGKCPCRTGSCPRSRPAALHLPVRGGLLEEVELG